MQKIMSIRINTEDAEFIKKTSKEEKQEKAKTVRELIEKGRLYLAIEQYREGRISIEKAAEKANKNLSEMLDLLAEFGVKNPMTKQQYLEGLKNVEEIF